MRLIDADKALKIAASYGTTHGTILGRHSGVADIIHYEIAKLPTIKAEPVKHGKWSLLKKLQHGKQYFLISVRFHVAFVDMVQLLVMNNPRMIGW